MQRRDKSGDNSLSPAIRAAVGGCTTDRRVGSPGEFDVPHFLQPPPTPSPPPTAPLPSYTTPLSLPGASSGLDNVSRSHQRMKVVYQHAGDTATRRGAPHCTYCLLGLETMNRGVRGCELPRNSERLREPDRRVFSLESLVGGWSLQRSLSRFPQFNHYFHVYAEIWGNSCTVQMEQRNDPNFRIDS